MTKIKILIEKDERPGISELFEIEEAGILSIDEVGMKDYDSYIKGEMEESKADEWMQILYELEIAGTYSIEDIGARAFESYIKGEMDESQAEKWIRILTKVAEFANTQMEE